MKKLLALLPFLILMVGCSYNPTAVQVEIDSSFSQDKKELILQSLEDWSSKTNGGFGVTTISYVDGISGDTEDNCIKFINQDVEEEPGPGPGLGLLGQTWTNYSTVAHPTDHVQAKIYIWDGEADNTFGATARHEIGHALLLGHYCTETEGIASWAQCQVVAPDPEPSIMYPVINSISVVQPIDVYRFCQTWSCG